MKLKSCLFPHLAQGSLINLFSILDKAGRQFIDIGSKRVSVLMNQNHPISVFPVQSEHDNAIRSVGSGHQIQFLC